MTLVITSLPNAARAKACDNSHQVIHAEYLSHDMAMVIVAKSGTLLKEIQDAFCLTSRETEVTTLLALRYSNREIAEALGITEHTARRHTEHVLVKLRVHQRNGVAAAVHEHLSKSVPGYASRISGVTQEISDRMTVTSSARGADEGG
jgi:DNA-binding NarL/FixJ family response regulator